MSGPAADQELFSPLSGGIRLCYRIDGDPAARPLLLIAGLGLDLMSWPGPMITDLVGRGYYVIRFDNRDVGRSSLVDAPAPSTLRLLTARPRPDAYDLADMAADALGLLDHLGIETVDLVGMSMGGMIAQTIAARHPHRVRTLTSIFSTTGQRDVGQPARSSILRLARPPARTRAGVAARSSSMVRHLAGPGYPVDDTAVRTSAEAAWDRGHGTQARAGLARQISAISRSGDRTAELGSVVAPTLVLHGDRDLMVDPSGGAATARAIAGARLVTIPGLGHYLAPDAMPHLVQQIHAHVGRGPELPVDEPTGRAV